MQELDALLSYLRDPETPFGVMDPVYTVYLMYGGVRGLFRGFAEELSRMLGTLLVFVGAHFLYRPVSSLMIEHTRLESPEASLALAYLLMALLFLVAWKLLTLVLKKALDWTSPKQFHRVGGALTGGIQCALILGVVLTAVELSGHAFLREHLVERSWLGSQIQRLPPDSMESLLPGRQEQPESGNGSGDA